MYIIYWIKILPNENLCLTSFALWLIYVGDLEENSMDPYNRLVAETATCGILLFNTIWMTSNPFDPVLM